MARHLRGRQELRLGGCLAVAFERAERVCDEINAADAAECEEVWREKL